MTGDAITRPPILSKKVRHGPVLAGIGHWDADERRARHHGLPILQPKVLVDGRGTPIDETSLILLWFLPSVLTTQAHTGHHRFLRCFMNLLIFIYRGYKVRI